MHSYEVRRHIEARPDAIWSVLTDVERLVAAGTGINRVEGKVEDGSTFTLWSQDVPGRGFRTKVETWEPPHRMVWVGGLPGGLFRGRRTFTLTEARQGTDFHMREEFTGLLLPLVWRSMPDLQPSFETFADGLARSAEATR